MSKFNFCVTNTWIESALLERGADFVHFVDTSPLPETQTQDCRCAILIGLILSREFIRNVAGTPDYVQKLVESNDYANDEYLNKEAKADELANYMADILALKGYTAISLSELRNEAEGRYVEETKTSILPHKIIAGMAGLGWIGRNNLLITQDYGCALCLCSVLTDAPLETVSTIPEPFRCGPCRICKDKCPANAITGNQWSPETEREDLVDVSKCITCLECMVFCRFTQRYMNST